MRCLHAALCVHLRDDHAVQLGIRAFSASRAQLIVREMQKITDQLVPLRTRHFADRQNKVVIHAHTGMLIKAPWEQYMVYLRAYPFKGIEFHGRNPQAWVLYVLNTFPLGVDALDPLNTMHHQHIGVGLSILFFEVINKNPTNGVMNVMMPFTKLSCQSTIYAYKI